MLAFVVVVCIAGYMLYRYYYHAETPPADPDENIIGWSTFCDLVPDSFPENVISLFSSTESTYWEREKRLHKYSDSKIYCYWFLYYFYKDHVPDERRKVSRIQFILATHVERFKIMYDAFNVEMEIRRNPL